MQRAEREIELHKNIYKDYIERKQNKVCSLVDEYWHSEIFGMAEKYIEKKEIRFLDLGAGTCLFFELFINRPDVSYTGVDVSDSMLEYAKSIYGKYPNFISYQMNLDGPYLIDEIYDIYAMRSLVHHLENKEVFLQSMFFKIPKGSLVVISEPNRNIITHALREMLKKIKKGHFDDDHVDLKPSFFLDQFKKNGVELLELKYFGYFSYPFSFPYILKLPMTAPLVRFFIFLDKIISKIFVANRFSWHVIYLVRKE